MENKCRSENQMAKQTEKNFKKNIPPCIYACLDFNHYKINLSLSFATLIFQLSIFSWPSFFFASSVLISLSKQIISLS